MTEWPKWVEERRTHLKVHQVQAGAPGTWCKAHTFKSAPGARKKCTRCKCSKKKFRGPLGKKCTRCRGPSGKRRQCNQRVTTAAVPGGHWITVCDTNTRSWHATRHTATFLMFYKSSGQTKIYVTTHVGARPYSFGRDFSLGKVPRKN